MKKIWLLCLSFVMILGLASCGEEGTSSEETNINSSVESVTPSEKNDPEMIDYIQFIIDRTPSSVPYWNRESFKGIWNYIDGVMLTSLLDLFQQTQNESYLKFVVKYVNYYIDSNGEFLNLKDPAKSGYNIEAYRLDDICSSRILFDLYEYTADSRYLVAIDHTFRQVERHPRTLEGNFWHKLEYRQQVWLDGLYMVNPFYIQYANQHVDGKLNVNGNFLSYYDDILNQYTKVRETMFDTEKKLYYHGYDSTKTIFWADPTTGCSKSFWLRSMGWLLVSMIDVISMAPEGTLKSTLTDYFIEAVEGIMQYQDPETKMFYQLIDKGPEVFYLNDKYITGGLRKRNYLETSGSSMISYALLKGARLGILDSKYRVVGEEVFTGIRENYLWENFIGGLSLGGICITAGLGPENNTRRDGTPEYYLSEEVVTDDAKGVGPFIMAYIELIK